MIRRGRGVATIYYPTGFNGGGDPDQVIMRLKPDGTVDITNATCEMGQGFKAVARMMGAEALGIDISQTNIDNTNTDTCGFSMDTAGSRSTYIVGRAAIAAAEDLKQHMRKFVSGLLSCESDKLEVDDGRVFVKDDPTKGMTFAEIGGASTYSANFLVGNGGFMPPPGPPREIETGQTVPTRTMAWGSSVIDIELDDETGVVEIVNCYNCYDMGTVINPLSATSQVLGGEVQGIGMALFEDLTPSYPNNIDVWTKDFTDYVIPTFMDAPKNTAIEFYENYDPYGPFGAKGCGEMVNDTQPPAIINAIHDAAGIWVNSLPATPEKVLRLLDEKASAKQ